MRCQHIQIHRNRVVAKRLAALRGHPLDGEHGAQLAAQRPTAPAGDGHVARVFAVKHGGGAIDGGQVLVGVLSRGNVLAPELYEQRAARRAKLGKDGKDDVRIAQRRGPD